MENIERRKIKRKNTRTKRRIRRRTGKKSKTKAALQRRKEFLGNLRITMERNCIEEKKSGVKRYAAPRKTGDTLGNLRVAMERSFMIEWSMVERKEMFQMKRNLLCSFRIIAEGKVSRTVFWTRILKILNLFWSWTGGLEMKEREQGVSWLRDLWAWTGRRMKGLRDLRSGVLVWQLKARKRTRIKELIFGRWMGKELGMKQALVEMQWPRTLQEASKIKLECPNQWRKLTKGWRGKGKRERLKINKETYVKVKIRKHRASGRTKTGRRRRKRRIKQRRKRDIRNQIRIKLKVATRVTLMVLSIKPPIFPKTVTRRLLWRVLSKNEKIWRRMVSCMTMHLGWRKCQSSLLTCQRMERNWNLPKPPPHLALTDREQLIILRWMIRITR